MKKFSKQTIDKLEYYVYLLTTIDEERNERIFYVGKGRGNRVFEHFVNKKIDISTLKDYDLNLKKKIIASSKCNAYIISAQLKNKEALKLESVLIDVLSILPVASLANIIKGQHNYGIHNVDNIEFKYANSIDLEEFCKKNKIKVLTLKTKGEFYYNSIKKDFRGVLEGYWSMDVEKLKKVDYVIGIHEQTIYGVYRYIKGTVKNIGDFTQETWDRWQYIHSVMGNNWISQNIEDINIDKKVFELSPVAIPETQNTHIKINVSNKDRIIGKKLLNRTIINKKIKAQSSRNYFGFNYLK